MPQNQPVMTDEPEQIGDSFYFDHDPDNTSKFPFNWAPYLTKKGGLSIVGALGLTDDTGLTVTVQNDAKTVTLYAQGGTPGNTARLTCRITTDGPVALVQDRSIFLRIKPR